MFYEKSGEQIPFFVFEELDSIPGFLHAFTSRRTDAAIKDVEAVSEVALQKPDFLRQLNVAEQDVVLVDQIHSNRILRVADCNGTRWRERERAKADAVLVEAPGSFAAVRTADCLPILLVAPEEGKFCVVHAGWRGTREHITSCAARSLLESCACDAAHITAAIGPAIRVCCYQVGSEVRSQFESAGHDVSRVFDGDRLDLIGANRLDLEALGIRHILDSELCTSCRSDVFYSYRRRKDTGRMWALAGFR